MPFLLASILIYALIQNSFDKLVEFPYACKSCGKEFVADGDVNNLDMEINIDLNKIDYYNVEDKQMFLNDSIEITFGFNPERVKIFLFNKTLEEKDKDIDENIKKENDTLSAIDNIIYFIKKVKVYKNKKLSSELDNIEEIYKFIHNIPIKLKDKFISQLNLENIEKLIPLFKCKSAPNRNRPPTGRRRCFQLA